MTFLISFLLGVVIDTENFRFMFSILSTELTYKPRKRKVPKYLLQPPNRGSSNNKTNLNLIILNIILVG